MRALLWPDAGVEQHLKELDAIFTHPRMGTLPTAILVSEGENGALIFDRLSRSWNAVTC